MPRSATLSRSSGKSGREAELAAPPIAAMEPVVQGRVCIREMQQADVPAVLAIDRRVTGRDRSARLTSRIVDLLQAPDVRLPLVAEIEGRTVGFALARLDLGEYRLDEEPAAVLDGIGVDPAFRGMGVGGAIVARLMELLRERDIATIRHELDWNGDRDLAPFLARHGFLPSQVLVFERDTG